jgi:D-alanine-D-alanine ligase
MGEIETTRKQSGTAVTEKQTVIVLFGGRSAEHDVSRTSAVAVLRSIDQSRYDVVPIGITPSGGWVVSVSAQSYLQAIANGADPATLPGQVDPVGASVDPSFLLPALAGGTTAYAEAVLNAVPAAKKPAGKEPAGKQPGLGENLAESAEGQSLAHSHAQPHARATVATGVQESGSRSLPVVLPILHGPFGEDGTMQGLLELAGVPYVGPGVLASAVAMDKGVAKELFAVAGLQQAKWLTIAAWDVADGADQTAFIARAGEELGYPMFVKPANMGSSVGVSKAVDSESLHTALETAFGFDDYVVVEETIHGREIEFAVLGNENPEVSIAGEIEPGADFYDYDDKYLDDSAKFLIPAPMPADTMEEGRALALRAYKALRCEGMSRVDFFLDDGSRGGTGRGWVINEINTIPGFTPISMYPRMWEASGVSYTQLLDKLIALAVSRHARRSGRVGRSRHQEP